MNRHISHRQELHMRQS